MITVVANDPVVARVVDIQGQLIAAQIAHNAREAYHFLLVIVPVAHPGLVSIASDFDPAVVRRMQDRLTNFPFVPGAFEAAND
jgi:hypothetical protein